MTEQAKTLYTAKTHTTGGRDGAGRSSDGQLDVKLTTPGSPGTGTNPEQLLAVGWSACFLSAIPLVARELGVPVPAERSIDAEVDLAKDENGFFLRARLKVGLPGVEHVVAEKLVAGAHEMCPYSKALRGSIDVTVELV